MSKATIALALVTAALSQSAHADLLWDQSDFNQLGNGYYNSVSGSPPFGSTQYVVSDVTVIGSWHVESVTTYFNAINPSWGDAISEGYLHIFPKTASAPITGTDIPAAGATIPMTGVSVGGGVVEVRATGLAVDLSAGDYWIGITPIAPSGPFGPEIQMSSFTFYGAETSSYDPFQFPGPPAWFTFNAGIDQSIKVEGTRPVSVESTSWSRIKAQYR